MHFQDKITSLSNCIYSLTHNQLIVTIIIISTLSTISQLQTQAKHNLFDSKYLCFIMTFKLKAYCY